MGRRKRGHTLRTRRRRNALESIGARQGSRRLRSAARCRSVGGGAEGFGNGHTFGSASVPTIRTDHARRPAPGNRSRDDRPNQAKASCDEESPLQSVRSRRHHFGGARTYHPARLRACGIGIARSAEAAQRPGFGRKARTWTRCDACRPVARHTAARARFNRTERESWSPASLAVHGVGIERAASAARKKPATSSFATCRQRGSASRATSIGSRLGTTRRSGGRQRQEGNGRSDAVRLSTRGMLRRV